MGLAEFLALDAAAQAAHIATLTGEQLSELRSALQAHFAGLDTDGATAEDVAVMGVCVAATELVEAENTTRETAAAETAAERERLRAQMSTPEDTPSAEGDTPPAEGEVAPEGETPPAEGDQTPEAIAAAAAAAEVPAARRAALGTMQRRAPATAAPRTQGPATIPFTVANGVPGYTAGATMDWDELGAMSVRKLENLDGFEGNDGKFAVAHASWLDQFPEDRIIRKTASAAENTRKVEVLTSLDSMVAAAQAFAAANPNDADAMVAAGGGFCAPFPVAYDVPTIGSLDRPVRDAFARFGADRGGLQFSQPPVLSTDPATDGNTQWTATNDTGVSLNGATGVYTSATLKGIVDYACLPTVTEQVYAVPMRQSFSNFNARFNPEQVGSHQRLGMVNHARYAETLLLQALYTKVSFRVTTGKTLGTARDFFALLDTVLWQIRGRERIGRDFPQRCIAPIWLLDMFRADFVRSMPTADYDTAMALADAVVLRWLAARRVNMSWALDDRTGSASYYRTQPTLDTAGAGTAVLLDFPDTVEWYLFPEGSYQFLDGGTIDLGIVRDTRTNAVNRFETFVETFEGLAKRGTYGYCVSSAFEPVGTASALKAIDTLDL